MKKRMFLTVVALLTAGAILAAPAPWYKWKSKLDGKVFCFQTSPGEGWERLSGPYKDARCETPGRPGE